MNIGELFVNLGVKGSEKTLGALGGIKKGLGEAKSMSLEAKAGIAAVIYGMEKLMQNSAQTGTGLTNFAASTGLSIKSLQQWQYAARQAGVSGEELTGSVKAVQTSMTNMLLGKGAPEGMGMLARTVGFDPRKVKDTFYVMDKLQEFAKRAPPELATSVIKSFGVNENVIAAMRRNVFRPDVFQKAPVYSDKETGQLDKVNVAWSNLGQKIEMAMGHLNAKHGVQLVQDLSKVTDQVVKMIGAFTTLAEKLKVFQAIGKVFEGWGLIFNKVNESVTDITKGDIGKGLNNILPSDKAIGETLKGAYLSLTESSVSPSVKAPGGTGTNQNITVNQDLHFQHDGKDHQKTGSSVHKAVKQAFKQTSQGQVS